MRNTKEDFLKAIVSRITATEDEVRGMSYEQYCMNCDLAGVKCSFDDTNFAIFLVGKAFKEMNSNPTLFDLVYAAMNKFRFFNVRSNEKFAEVAANIGACELMNNHEACKCIVDYCLKFYPAADVSKRMLQLAYSFGMSNMNYSKIIELRRKYGN